MPARLVHRAFALALAVGLAGFGSAAHALVFAVNEGVTYRVGNDEIRAKYAALSADLSRILKQPVQVEPIGDYPTLRQGLATKAYDLAYVHPAHLSIVAIRDSGYKLLAVTKGFTAYTASFLARADSPVKQLADLKGRTVGVPDEDSITSWMVRATLRDALGSSPSVKYDHTRYQDAVPFFVEHRLAAAGATAATAVVRAWEAKGDKVIGRSKPVPIKHMLAGPGLTPDQVQAVREYLLGLDGNDEGKRKLEAIKYQGFAPFAELELLAIGKWLGL